MKRQQSSLRDAPTISTHLVFFADPLSKGTLTCRLLGDSSCFPVTFFIESSAFIDSASFFETEAFLIRHALFFFSAAVIFLPPPLLIAAALIFTLRIFYCKA
jgi:hypothetical protein